MKWISVKKRLLSSKDEMQVALWRLDDGCADVAFWDGQYFYIGGERMKPHEYSHWFPLPAPPTEEA